MNHDQPPADPAAYIHQVAALLREQGLHGDVRVDTPEEAADLGRQWGEVVFPSRHGITGCVWLSWSDVPDNPEYDLQAGWKVMDFNRIVARPRPGGLRHPSPEEAARAAYPHIAARIPVRT